MRIGSLTLAGVVLAADPCAAPAQQLDMTILHARGTWEVLHTHDAAEGVSWCSATTENPTRQWFSIVGFDSGEVALFIGDRRWTLAQRPVGFRLEVDRRSWTLGGEAGGSSVSVFLSGQDQAVPFLADLRASAAVAAFTEEGDRLATFSLAGSRAALDALAECALGIARPASHALPATADPL